jgi:hypothetical protein
MIAVRRLRERSEPRATKHELEHKHEPGPLKFQRGSKSAEA